MSTTIDLAGADGAIVLREDGSAEVYNPGSANPIASAVINIMTNLIAGQNTPQEVGTYADTD